VTDNVFELLEWLGKAGPYGKVPKKDMPAKFHDAWYVAYGRRLIGSTHDVAWLTSAGRYALAEAREERRDLRGVDVAVSTQQPAEKDKSVADHMEPPAPMSARDLLRFEELPTDPRTVGRLAKRLERLRNQDRSCCVTLEDSGRNKPRFLYPYHKVRHILAALKTSLKRPSE
jgi:hypothetical protein